MAQVGESQEHQGTEWVYAVPLDGWDHSNEQVLALALWVDSSFLDEGVGAIGQSRSPEETELHSLYFPALNTWEVVALAGWVPRLEISQGPGVGEAYVRSYVTLAASIMPPEVPGGPPEFVGLESSSSLMDFAQTLGAALEITGANPSLLPEGLADFPPSEVLYSLGENRALPKVEELGKSITQSSSLLSKEDIVEQLVTLDQYSSAT